MNVSAFFRYLRQELGDGLYEIVGDRPFERWVNAGQRKLGVYRQRTVNLVWAVGATSVSLPADFHHTEEYVADPGTQSLPAGRAWDGEYAFDCPAKNAGSGKLRYYAVRPAITDDVESTLDDEGNEALVSYALYRFFKRLASSRSDYRMYATITGNNGVDIAELDAVGERHLQDFNDAKENLAPLEAVAFYEE